MIETLIITVVGAVLTFVLTKFKLGGKLEKVKVLVEDAAKAAEDGKLSEEETKQLWQDILAIVK